VAFDLETTSLDPMQAEFVGFSLAVAPGRACYVPLAHRAGSGFDSATATFGRRRSPRRWPRSSRCWKTRPSSKSGRTSSTTAWCCASTASSLAPHDDTLLMSYALDGGRGQHGLDALAERHLGHTCIPFTQVLEHAPGARKSDKTFAQVPLDKATQYAAEDAGRGAAAVDGSEAAARG